MRCSAGASPWEWVPPRQASDECELSIGPDGEGSFLQGSVESLPYILSSLPSSVCTQWSGANAALWVSNHHKS